MSSTDRLDAAVELRAAVQGLKTGDIPFVEGVRRVLSLRRRLGASDSDADFLVLVAVDSESDHLLVGDAKLFASPAWLERCAREEQELQIQAGATVQAACDRLIERFAREA